MTPNNIVNMSLLNGMDMIALTDHNSCKNCEAAVRAGKEAGVDSSARYGAYHQRGGPCGLPVSHRGAGHGLQRLCGGPVSKIHNRPEIFGDQLVMDWQDEVVGRVSQLLINASFISVNEMPQLMARFGGASFPPILTMIPTASFPLWA